MRKEGIRSVICLTHEKELQYYEKLRLHPDGLLGLLREMGLGVRHLPWPDPAHAPTAEERKRRLELVENIKRSALVAFNDLPKPTVIFCSAGIDRTPPIAAHIVVESSGSPGLKTSDDN